MVRSAKMEKFTVNSGGVGDVERDLEIGEAEEPLRENGKAGAGQNRTVTRDHSSNPRMLVGLDILCLIVGKNHCLMKILTGRIRAWKQTSIIFTEMFSCFIMNHIRLLSRLFTI